jgi:hypothetical protein
VVRFYKYRIRPIEDRDMITSKMSMSPKRAEGWLGGGGFVKGRIASRCRRGVLERP